QAFCTLLGYSEDELLAKNLHELTHPEDLPMNLDQIARLREGEIETFHIEKRYFHKDGHVVWGWLSCSLVHNRDGSPSHFVTQVRDITDRKNLEIARREMSVRDELTGLLNRRAMNQILDEEVKRSRRYG